MLDNIWTLFGLQLFAPEQEFTLDIVWIYFGHGFIFDTYWTWIKYGY